MPPRRQPLDESATLLTAVSTALAALPTDHPLPTHHLHVVAKATRALLTWLAEAQAEATPHPTEPCRSGLAWSAILLDFALASLIRDPDDPDAQDLDQALASTAASLTSSPIGQTLREVLALRAFAARYERYLPIFQTLRSRWHASSDAELDRWSRFLHSVERAREDPPAHNLPLDFWDERVAAALDEPAVYDVSKPSTQAIVAAANAGGFEESAGRVMLAEHRALQRQAEELRAKAGPLQPPLSLAELVVRRSRRARAGAARIQLSPAELVSALTSDFGCLCGAHPTTVDPWIPDDEPHPPALHETPPRQPDE